MISILVTQARNDIYNLINKVHQSHEPALIVSKNKNTVLIAEEDWNALNETVYLNSIPHMVDLIIEGGKEPLENCTKSQDIDW